MPKQTKEPTGANAVFVARAAAAGKRAIVFQSSMPNGYSGLSNFALLTTPFKARSAGKKRSYRSSEIFYQSHLAWSMGLPGLAKRIRNMPHSTRAEMIRIKHAASRKAMTEYIQEALAAGEPRNLILDAKFSGPLLHALWRETGGSDKRPRKAHIERVLKARHAELDCKALMREGLDAKFSQDAESRALLLATDDAMLGENSFRSGFWGIQKDGAPGFMGDLLMDVRRDLRRGALPAAGGGA
jgi:hypothetical protein